MDKPQIEYVKTLETFLTYSNQDILDAKEIIRQMPVYAPHTQTHIINKKTANILDIGCGNGAKTIHIANELKKIGINPSIDFTEPKIEQRKILLKNYESNPFFHARIFNQTFATLETGKKYDIVLLLHSLYEFPRDISGNINSLERLNYFLKPSGVGAIIIEHPEDDFQRMKQELYPILGKNEPLTQEIITRTLKKYDLKFRVSQPIPLEFKLDLLIKMDDVNIGKNMSFLFSESLNPDQLTEKQYGLIGEWVKANAKQRGTYSYLKTDDVIIWCYNK